MKYYPVNDNFINTYSVEELRELGYVIPPATVGRLKNKKILTLSLFISYLSREGYIKSNSSAQRGDYVKNTPEGGPYSPVDNDFAYLYL